MVEPETFCNWRMEVFEVTNRAVASNIARPLVFPLAAFAHGEVIALNRTMKARDESKWTIQRPYFQ